MFARTARHDALIYLALFTGGRQMAATASEAGGSSHVLNLRCLRPQPRLASPHAHERALFQRYVEERELKGTEGDRRYRREGSRVPPREGATTDVVIEET